MRTKQFGSVWATGQHTAHAQRGDRYAAASIQHPAKMLPAIARHAIAAYSNPGDVVLDPMCGIGTVLVEAIDIGRRGLGVEYEPQWAATCAANIHLARQRHPGLPSWVWLGDARKLTAILPSSLVGTVDLIVTSPPYGSDTHGYWRGNFDKHVRKRYYRYGTCRRDKTQLAHRNLTGLQDGMTQIFIQCRHVLKPGGRLVLTARPWIQHGHLVDFPSIVTSTAQAAGFVAWERCVALLGRWDARRIVPHHSYFKLHNVRRARANGSKPLLTAHEDVLVFTKPGSGPSPGAQS